MSSVSAPLPTTAATAAALAAISSALATDTEVLAAAGSQSWKTSVRLSDRNSGGILATDFENGDSLDGGTLATGDRILLTFRTDQTENGIYTVNASGAPTRATDMDASAELFFGVVQVREGGTQAGKVWVCSNTSAITFGVTNITFVLFETFLAGLTTDAEFAALSGSLGALATLSTVSTPLGATFGDGVSVPTAGAKFRQRVNGARTISKASMVADASGSAVIDVKKCTYSTFPGSLASICAAAKPTLATAQKSEDGTLTGWTLAVADGDVIEYTLDSATTVKQVTLTLHATGV